jgi:hypothetical protein
VTPDLVAAIAATERDIADRLDSFGVPDPQEAAHRLVRWMQGRGWRVHPALADKPPAVPPARSAVARQKIAEAKAAAEAKYGNRPELAGTTPAEDAAKRLTDGGMRDYFDAQAAELAALLGGDES